MIESAPSSSNACNRQVRPARFPALPGYTITSGRSCDNSTFKSTGSTHAKTTSVRYAGIKTGKKVAYVEFFKDMVMGGASGAAQEGIGVMRLNASYDDTTGGTPIYFLPWDTTGAVIRLVIPRRGVNDPDPDIFFTAAINGCSVFFQGTPDHPTVYHAGGSSGESDHNQAARFWREALSKHIAASATALGRGGIKAEVNKTHYVKTAGTVGNSSTPRAEEYERYLKEKLDKVGKFTVTMVNPWGCVMGIRTGNDWMFYLQENSTVICNNVTKTGVQVRYYARPMNIRQIFPGNGAISSMRATVPVKVT